MSDDKKVYKIDVDNMSPEEAKEFFIETLKKLKEEQKKKDETEEPVTFFDDWDPQGNDTF